MGCAGYNIVKSPTDSQLLSPDSEACNLHTAKCYTAPVADAPSAGRRRNYKEESDSGPSESDEEEAQDPFAADDLDDPTIVDSTGQVNRAGWALNHSRWEGDLQGRPKLPRELAKQLGRR